MQNIVYSTYSTREGGKVTSVAVSVCRILWAYTTKPDPMHVHVSRLVLGNGELCFDPTSRPIRIWHTVPTDINSTTRFWCKYTDISCMDYLILVYIHWYQLYGLLDIGVYTLISAVWATWYWCIYTDISCVDYLILV